MWNIFSLYCVIDEISWSRVTFEAGTILSLLNCVVVVFKRMSYFFYIYNKKKQCSMQNNLSSSSGIQTPNEFSFELDVTKINLKHTQKNKDWADLPLFLHLTFLACLLPIVCLFVICCCLSCILIKVLSVLRTFGVQLSSSLPLTSLTFAQKIQRLFFSRLKLYAFNVQCLCTVRAIETYSILIMVFSPKYKTAMNM